MTFRAFFGPRDLSNGPEKDSLYRLPPNIEYHDALILSYFASDLSFGKTPSTMYLRMLATQDSSLGSTEK